MPARRHRKAVSVGHDVVLDCAGLYAGETDDGWRGTLTGHVLSVASVVFAAKQPFGHHRPELTTSRILSGDKWGYLALRRSGPVAVAAVARHLWHWRE